MEEKQIILLEKKSIALFRVRQGVVRISIQQICVSIAPQQLNTFWMTSISGNMGCKCVMEDVGRYRFSGLLESFPTRFYRITFCHFCYMSLLKPLPLNIHEQYTTDCYSVRNPKLAQPSRICGNWTLNAHRKPLSEPRCSQFQQEQEQYHELHHLLEAPPWMKWTPRKFCVN